MHKLIGRSFLLIVVLAGFLYGTPAPGASAAAVPGTQAIYALTQLGAPGDIVLHGPYDTTSLRFDLPPSWALQDGASLNLLISVYVDSGGTFAQGQTLSNSGALLDVYFNGKLQQALALNSGENLQYNVPVSVDSLASPYPDGRFQITFLLDASYDCRGDRHTTIKIAGVSQAVLPYVHTALQLDLHRLPWPIYQPRVQTPAPATLVVPTTPTAAQLNAALLVMATLGRMSNSQLPVNMITADQLTQAAQNQSDLVFVGPASAFPMLAGINFPVPAGSSGYASTEMQADDGIVEMASSPWNSDKSLLLVGGNSDAGLVKAAQALSTGNLQTSVLPTYSIVAQVHPVVQAGLLNATPSVGSSDYKLSDLGYSILTYSGAGTRYFTYEFTIPPGQVVTEGAYLKLVYSYSTLVDPNLSSADVYLNQQRIGSITIDAEHPNSATIQVPLPASVMQPGRNTLEIAAGLLPKDSCLTFTFNDLWMTVFPDSVMHLPLTNAAPASDIIQDIKAYPKPFNSDPALSTVAFVLPQKDAGAWTVAGQVAYSLGAQATGSALSFEAAFDGQVNEEMHGRHLIVVGLPAELTVLQDLTDTMPASFAKNSNVAVLQSQEVVYRIPPGKDLGYLELFPSTWSNQRAVLLVLGTTAKGVASAGAALTNPNMQDVLHGNFVTVDGQQLLVVDTRTGLGLGRLVPEVPAEGTPSPEQASVSTNADQLARAAVAQQRQMVLIALVVVLIGMALIVALAFLLRRRAQPKNG